MDEEAGDFNLPGLSPQLVSLLNLSDKLLLAEGRIEFSAPSPITMPMPPRGLKAPAGVADMSNKPARKKMPWYHSAAAP